jgi:hypothetical protein
VKNKPQHQGSLEDQLRELVHVANKEGLYDAADWLLGFLELRRLERNTTSINHPNALHQNITTA